MNEITCYEDDGGTKSWFLNGELHRDDGPAVEYIDGSKRWYQRNLLHRDGGPAIEAISGSKRWYQNDILHRDDGPALTGPPDASGAYHKEWYTNGECHRADGPAVEYIDGSKRWYLYGKRHREDGPASENSNGLGQEWYLNNKLTSPLEVFKKATSVQRKHILCFYASEICK